MPPELAAGLRDLYEFSRLNATARSWGRVATGSFNPKFDVISAKSLYSVYSNGRLYLNFRWLRHTETGREAAGLLGEKLRAVGFPIPEDYRERFVGLGPDVWILRLGKLKEVVLNVVDAAKDR